MTDVRCKPDDSDTIVAQDIARVLTEHEPMQYWFAIDHDVRAAASRSGKPRTGACPVYYTWTHKDLVGLDTKWKNEAEAWIVRALLAGYRVHRMRSPQNPVGVSYSIASVRRAHEYANMMAGAPDDDIPF